MIAMMEMILGSDDYDYNEYDDRRWWSGWIMVMMFGEDADEFFFEMMIAMIDEMMMIMKMNMWRLVVWFCLWWEADEDGDAFSMMMEKMRTEEMEMIEEGCVDEDGSDPLL